MIRLKLFLPYGTLGVRFDGPSEAQKFSDAVNASDTALWMLFQENGERVWVRPSAVTALMYTRAYV